MTEHLTLTDVLKNKPLRPGDRVVFTERLYPDQGVDVESAFYGTVFEVDDVHVCISYNIPRGFTDLERRALHLTWREMVERLEQNRLRKL